MKSSDKTWPTEGGNGNPFQYFWPKNPMGNMKRQKDMTAEDEPPRSEGVQYVTGEERREITNRSRKKEAAGPKGKPHSVVDVSGGASQLQCCKEQYCIGIWIVMSTNKGKLDTVKQEMARMNIDILGISEIKCMGMGKFNSDDHYIYQCQQEFLRRNGAALIVYKRV